MKQDALKDTTVVGLRHWMQHAPPHDIGTVPVQSKRLDTPGTFETRHGNHAVRRISPCLQLFVLCVEIITLHERGSITVVRSGWIRLPYMPIVATNIPPCTALCIENKNQLRVTVMATPSVVSRSTYRVENVTNPSKSQQLKVVSYVSARYSILRGTLYVQCHR